MTIVYRHPREGERVEAKRNICFEVRGLAPKESSVRFQICHKESGRVVSMPVVVDGNGHAKYRFRIRNHEILERLFGEYSWQVIRLRLQSRREEAEDCSRRSSSFLRIRTFPTKTIRGVISETWTLNGNGGYSTAPQRSISLEIKMLAKEIRNRSGCNAERIQRILDIETVIVKSGSISCGAVGAAQIRNINENAMVSRGVVALFDALSGGGACGAEKVQRILASHGPRGIHRTSGQPTDTQTKGTQDNSNSETGRRQRFAIATPRQSSSNKAWWRVAEGDGLPASAPSTSQKRRQVEAGVSTDGFNLAAIPYNKGRISLGGWFPNYCELPLHLACSNNCPLDVIQILVKAFPEAVHIVNRQGQLPIHLAGNQDVIQYLMKSMKPGHPINLAAVPFHWICQEAILANGPREGYDAWLPLHWACLHRCSLNVIQVLLKAHRDAAHIAIREGMLPLHIACNLPNPSTEVIRHLLKANFKAAKIRNRRGCLPLELALRNGADLEAIRMLVKETPTDSLMDALAKGYSSAFRSGEETKIFIETAHPTIPTTATFLLLSKDPNDVARAGAQALSFLWGHPC